MREVSYNAGAETTHHVNRTLVQPGMFQHMENVREIRRKPGRQSLSNISKHNLPEYYNGKTCGPRKISFPAYDNTCLILSVQKQLFLSWIMCRQFHQQQYMPSCTGFNIHVCDQVVVMESTVHYLDVLTSLPLKQQQSRK